MDIQLTNASGSVAVADAVFGANFNEALIHQVVVAQLAGARAGTKAQKTRSEVSGGGAKPWKQKGTGRARAGTIRSPIWVGGGRAFAAKPRNFEQKVNRKMYRGALRSIFSELIRQDRLVAFDTLTIDAPKTKSFLSFAKELNLGNDVLVISESLNDNAFLAARNLPNVAVVDVPAIDPALLIAYKKIAIDKAALEKINEWLS